MIRRLREGREDPGRDIRSSRADLVVVLNSFSDSSKVVVVECLTSGECLTLAECRT